MAALSVTSTPSVKVPDGAKDVQNVGPGRVALDSTSAVTFVTGLVLEVNGVYSAALNDSDPTLWAIAESATSSLRYII